MPYATREAFAAFRRSPLLTFLSAAMIALSLFVAGLFGVVAYNIRETLQRIESRVEIVAYLRDSAAPQAVQALEAEIRTEPGVSEVIYVSREQALEQAKHDMVELRPVFSNLDSNPLPASLDIRLRGGQRNAAAVRALAKKIQGQPNVEQVRFGNDWLDKVFLLRRIAAVATLVLGGAFALVATVIIGAAVRMAIFARRDEIQIMRLVGATDGFVRRPFVIEGLITGLIGGALALGLTYASYTVLSDAVFRLQWIPPSWIAAGVAAGALLGILASAVSVRRYLREV